MEILKTGLGKGWSYSANTEKLHLDKDNPRLSELDQGKTETEVLTALYRNFGLDELAFSLAENGYFNEEPLVVVPVDLPQKFVSQSNTDLLKDPDYISYIQDSNTEFIVIEGNRRLSTVKILLSEQIKSKLRIISWPSLKEDVKQDLQKLPVIIYSRREDVLPYLGVRHIVGIKKWESYAKARYIASMIEKGFTIEEVQNQVGDRLDSIRRIYICFQILNQVQDEFDIDTSEAKNKFSFLMLAIGQGSIKTYLGLPKKLKDINLDEPVSKEKKSNLKNLYSWMYGEGKEIQPVISESRDITNKLTNILDNEESTKYLLASRDIIAAYDLSDGEENLLIKYLKNSNRYIQLSLGLLHRHKDNLEVVEEIKKLDGNLEAIHSTLD